VNEIGTKSTTGVKPGPVVLVTGLDVRGGEFVVVDVAEVAFIGPLAAGTTEVTSGEAVGAEEAPHPARPVAARAGPTARMIRNFIVSAMK
jgi:hypothetical protein